MNELIINQLINIINSIYININSFIDNHQVLVSGLIGGSFAILGTFMGNRSTHKRERRQWAKEKIYSTYVSVISSYSDLIGLTYSSDHDSLKASNITLSNLIGSLSSILMIVRPENQKEIQTILNKSLNIKEHGLIQKSKIPEHHHPPYITVGGERMSWLRYNRHTPCPVCQGERSDCRQNTTTGLIHCRSNEANPKDYLYRGQDTWGFNLWAKAVTSRQSPVTSERQCTAPNNQTEVNPRFLAIRGEDLEARERATLEKLLPIPERDKVIREILAQLTLSDDHREVLRNRGISDRKIEESNYRSVKQWQKLTSSVTNELSGVKYDGLSLINHTDGILIPIPNEDGLYTHLRVNDLTPGTENKYYPLSSSKRGVKYHLPSGEQPIATYLPLEAPQKEIIGFTEGLEYKPLLASSKMGIPIIGASGGNFGSSPGAIETAIASIKERYGWEKPKFILYADAGSVINPNVVIQYEKLGKIVPNLKVVDWGQLEEGHEVIKINTKGCEVLLTTQEFIDGEKEQGEAIYRETSSAIATSNDISLEQAQAIMRKATATQAERYEATKAFITEEIPGIELTTDFINEYIVKDRRRALNAIKLCWKLLNPEAAKYYDEKEYSHQFRQFAIHSIVYLPDIRAYYPLVKELSDLGLLEVIDNPDKEYTQDDHWLEEFKQKCCLRRHRLYRLFNIIVTKKSKAVHLLNRFLEKIGLGLTCNQKRVEGQRVRTYKLNPKKLNNPDRNAILNAFDLKWRKTVTSRQSPVTSYGQLTVTNRQSKVNNPSMTTRNEDEKTTLVTGEQSLVTVETKTRYGLEGVTELPRNSYTINQQEGSVTVANDLITIDVDGVENGTRTTNVVAEVTVKNEGSSERVQSTTGDGLEGVTELDRKPYTINQQESSVTAANDLITIGGDGVENGTQTVNVVAEAMVKNEGSSQRVQTDTGYGLEGVTELPRKPYTNNQQETNVTEALKLENDKPFWWGHSCDRYAPEFEVVAHTAYWWLLASETFEGLQEAKKRITQLSQNLGWGSHQLLNWLFERMPDEAMDHVEGLTLSV